MGRVFTWEEIHTGSVPALHAFKDVTQALRRRAVNEESVHGLLVFGSVLRGDHSIRSDLDCFVLYDTHRMRDAYEFMWEIDAEAAKSDVPLSFTPCDHETAQTMLHHIGPSFREHLRKSAAAGGLLKGDPFASIGPSMMVEEEAEGYLRTKLYNLGEAWSEFPSFSEERAAVFLKKLTEAPVHVARKMLVWHGKLKGDSKNEVLVSYGDIASGSLVDELKCLVSLDGWYTEQVRMQLNKPNKREYELVLNRLVDHAERIISFVRANVATLAAANR